MRLTQLLAPTSKNDPVFPVGMCMNPHMNAAQAHGCRAASQSCTDTPCSYTNSSSGLTGGAGWSSSSGEYTCQYGKVDPSEELGSDGLTTDTSVSAAGSRLQPRSC